MAPWTPPRRPTTDEDDRRPSMLPDRTREVSAAPELDGAVSSLLDLARWAKARRHRGRLTPQEAETVEVALQRRTGAFSAAVRRMLQSPARRRPVAGPPPASTGSAEPAAPARSSLSSPPRTASLDVDEPEQDDSARG